MKQDLYILGFLSLEIVENTILIFGLTKLWEVLSNRVINNYLYYVITMLIFIFLIIEKYMEIRGTAYIWNKINEKKRR